MRVPVRVLIACLLWAIFLPLLAVDLASAYSPAVERGLGVGYRFGGPALCGQPSVQTATPEQYAATREWRTAEERERFLTANPIAWAERERCLIVFNARPPERILTPERRCQVTAHEYVHLAGFRDARNKADPDHSIDPRSLMYAEDHVQEFKVWTGRRLSPWRASGYVRGCSRRAPIVGSARA